tara:strand:+ start:5438 stop:6157 length:720 start_codon:yes stop_codon:yes gene_type:complete
MKRISKTLMIISLFVFSFSAQASPDEYYRTELTSMTRDGHRPLTSYSQARQYIMQKVHLKKDNLGYYVEDVYCHQSFRKRVGPNNMPSHQDVNIEHTWPQSRFNTSRSKSFQKADLHHLYPTQSRANSTRGNVIFQELNAQNAEPVNGCDLSLSGYANGTRGFEPPEDHKGNVARALFYFSLRYDLRISYTEEVILRAWNNSDPVDDDERRRNDIIEQIQGNRNPFIDDAELADFISDF